MARVACGGNRRARLIAAVFVAAMLGTLTFTGVAASAPRSHERALVTITVDTLPIANALPMDLGIKKGFFEAEGSRSRSGRCRAATTSSSRSRTGTATSATSATSR